MERRTTIVIIDDHPLFREGLKTILARNGSYEVAGEAGTGHQGLQIVQKLKPDLALVDISLPDQTGIGLIRDILRVSPDTRVMIVSMHSKIDYIVKAFQTGAVGYLAKESAAEMLLQGIDHILRGDYFMDTRISQQVIQKLVGSTEKKTVAAGNGYDVLTPREQEIMALLAEGRSVKRVAEKLFISRKTVENHRSNIMRKLDIHSNIELVRYAAKIGIIDVDLWKK